MILHIVLNEFTNDARVLNETESIVAAIPEEKELWVAALKGREISEYERIDNWRQVWRVPLVSRGLPKDLLSQTIKYIEWMFRIVVRFASKRPRIVHCHDLNALPVGVVLKVLCGSIVVYDAHELETERHGKRGIRKGLAKIIEKLLIPFVHYVITVSDSIARDYARRYKIRQPLVVRNIPKNVQLTVNDRKRLRRLVGIQEDSHEILVFLYQGGVSGGRGVERLLRVFQKVSSNRHIVFMGNGPLVKLVQAAAASHPNIHHIPAVPPDKVLLHTAGADVGIYLMEDTCLNHHYSLPNKLFEFIKAGIPVVINDLPEQRHLVERYDCGWVTSNDDHKLAKMINKLSMQDICLKRKNAERAAAELDWEKEVSTLCDIYRAMYNLKAVKHG